MKTTIGIFDSGVGGLTVLQEMEKALPHTNLVYVGDNKNCPYGDKTKEALYHCASKVVEYFIRKNIHMIVLACNTTSANILDDLRVNYPDVNFIGVIDSTVQSFLKKNKKEVLVVATKATVKSNKYEQTIHLYNKHIKVHSLATKKLVPLIESGEYKQGIQSVLSDYLKDYHLIDSIILGCTHYPIIMSQFKQVLGDIEYISSSEAVSKEVLSYLLEHHSIDQNEEGCVEIYTTGNAQEFIFASSSFYNYQQKIVKHIEV